MELKVGQKFVSGVSEIAPSTQINAKPSTPVQFGDRLVFENEGGFFGSIFGKVVGVFTWIKDTVVSIFRLIFCCDCLRGSGIAKLERNPAESKKIFEDLHTLFKTERDGDTSSDKSVFIAAWKEKFNSLDPEVQERIVKEDMKGWAIAKGEKGDGITSYVEGAYGKEAYRNQSLEFVRDLKPAANNRGTTYYPIRDTEVPRLLKRIADDYDAKAKAAEKAGG